jgi:hypothetical protein
LKIVFAGVESENISQNIKDIIELENRLRKTSLTTASARRCCSARG